MSLAILISHPIQYYAPLFREIARHIELTVFFAHQATPAQQAAAGFGVAFDWDLDLLEGYRHVFLRNIAREPGSHRFNGCDTPDIGHELARLRPEALLVMGWNLKTHWQGVWAAKRRGIPVLVRGDSHLDTSRGPAKRLVKELLYPALLRSFDAALYVGQRSRAYYEHYSYPASRLFFSPHCVDNNWFATRATPNARAALRNERRIREDAFVALFAGKLVDFKRPLDVVAAAAKCRSDGRAVEVMVAGSGQLAELVEGEAGRLNVPLHMLGFCNQTKMPAAYAAADVLILPSDNRETWGLVVNEALACGRPVIVSDACGCSTDMAGNCGVCRTFPLGDAKALASAISALYGSQPEADKFKQVTNRYSLSAAAAGVMDAVAYVASKEERPFIIRNNG